MEENKSEPVNNPNEQPKPRFLILGGLGFIGQALALHLSNNKLASFIGIADKTVPDIAHCAKGTLSFFKQKNVEDYLFLQTDLTKETMVNDVFNKMGAIDIVVNCTGETAACRDIEQYKSRALATTIACANIAAKHKVKKFIELSSCFITRPGSSKPTVETRQQEPWCPEAIYKMEAEKYLLENHSKSFELVILRLPIVYGPGDYKGWLCGFLISGLIYSSRNESMPLLWDEDLKRNTVHIDDVVRAVVHLVRNGRSLEIYNLVDDNDSNNGKLSALLSKMFPLKIEFAGSIKSMFFTKLNFESSVNILNERHMSLFHKLCSKHDIKRTPCELMLSKDMLVYNHLWVDGFKLKATNFTLKHPFVTKELLWEQYSFAIKEGYLPDVFGNVLPQKEPVTQSPGKILGQPSETNVVNGKEVQQEEEKKKE